MRRKTIGLSAPLYDYLLEVTLRESDVLAELRRVTAALPEAGMQIAPDQGQFMALLVRMMDARNVLEVGVFTGYSSLAVASALPPDGRIVACDVSEEWTAIGRRYWAEAGVEGKIDLRLGPGEETLQSLIAEGQSSAFDMAFIDADKESYSRYFEQSLELVRTGGLIMVDNVLWGGSVVDPEDRRESTEAIRRFNRSLTRDERVEISMLPVGDGLTLALKR